MPFAITELKSLFHEQGHPRSYRKGHIICSQGDTFSTVYMVTSGMVKNYDLDENGSERTISIFGRDNPFPILWLLADPPDRHLYYYEAFTDTEAYALSYEIVRKFLHDHPDMLLVVSDLLTKAYVNSIGQVENLEKSHIHERLEYVLYTLAARLGTNAGSVARIDALITQEDLARLAGVTRESMSLEMNRHRSRGLMWKKGNSTYIDVGRLDVASMPKFYAI